MNGRIFIAIRLASTMQIFNSSDPAPFHENEPDSAAEHDRIGTVKGFQKKTPFKKIVISLPIDILGPGGHSRSGRRAGIILHIR